MSWPMCIAAMRANVAARRSNLQTISASAPFCGAKTAAAPCAPNNGLSTSVAKTTSIFLIHESLSGNILLLTLHVADADFRHFIMPNPQSLTALPPSPTINFLNPF